MSTEEKPAPVFKKDVISRKKTVSFSMGFLINASLVTFYQFLVLYYYEVELGLATGLVALSFAIYAVWNMVNDPLFGYLTDRPMRWSKKYGMRAPWAIFGGLGVILCFYLLFAVPDFGDVKSNPWPLFWYMIIITCIYDTFYTIFTTHYFGGFANIFRTTEERRKGSTIGVVLGIGIRTVIMALLMPALIIQGDPGSYVRFALVLTIILCICLILSVPGVYENEFVKKRYLQIYEYLEAIRLPYFKFLKITFKQKNYMTLLIAYTLWQTAVLLVTFSVFYLIYDVLEFDISVLVYFALGNILAFFPSMYIFSKIAKKVDHSKVLGLGMVILGLTFIQGMWITTVPEFFFMNICAGIANAAGWCVSMSVTSDALDEVNLAAGRHVEAGLMGIQNFFLRSGFLTAALIIAAVHIATGYVPGASEQTDLAKLGVRMHFGLFSAILTWTAALIMFKVYDLRGEKKEAQMAALRKKGL